MIQPVDISTLVGMLGARIETLAAELLPNGRREGEEWRVGSIAGEAGQSMAVHLAGARAGVWCDFGGPPDHRGDALDLVAQVLFRGDKRRAVAWARAWLGLDARDPGGFAVERRQAVEKKERDRRREKERSESALRLWLAARPLPGTPSEEYLCSRAIGFAALGRRPAALRHHPGLVHPETGEIAPALVAAVTARDGTMTALHRTFLERRADGSVSKLGGVEAAKLSLGRVRGGCVRLWRGATGKPFAQALPGEWIIIGEGLEDTATAIMARPDLRAACAVSLANMGSLWLPPAIEGVILLAQNDAPDSAAVTALRRAVAHFQELGKRVKLARPPSGCKDINALALEESGAGAEIPA